MKQIELHHPYSKTMIPREDVVLVLGFFDGVHRGHQEVIKTGRRIATEKGLKLAVMTFNQHPSIVFQKVTKPMKYLTTVNKKAKLMADLKVDYLYTVDFTSAFAKLAPKTFVEEYIIALHAKVVIAGFDYSYGKAGKGNMTELPTFALGRFEVITVPCLTEEKEKISSTRIRHALTLGQMEHANHLLGYIYETEGIVIHGDARGRTLGFPTANIQVQADKRIPKEGVYAVKLFVNNQWYPAMAQIGFDVTFGSGRPLTVEVYILNFDQDIYGENVVIRWYHYFRDEIKFKGKEELIQQLQLDEKNTASYFSEVDKVADTEVK